MADERERRFVGAYVDAQTEALLRKLASQNFESNKSMMLRTAIREAAERRGVQIVEALPAPEEGGR